MYLRSYINKSNTIIKDNQFNSGKNPVGELFYGLDGNGEWTFSRLLVSVDISDLIIKYKDGMLGDLSEVTNKFKMVNTSGFLDRDSSNAKHLNKNRTASFELQLHKIVETWDEGIGYDFEVFNGSVNSEIGSNWFNSKTNQTWVEPGVLPNGTLIDTQEFDSGNENIEFDVGNLIKDSIINNENEVNLVISFTPRLENRPIRENDVASYKNGLQYVGFFTNNTQTFFKGFVETQYKSYIKDDRNEFYPDKKNRLYLYVNANGSPKNVDVNQNGENTLNVKLMNHRGDDISMISPSPLVNEVLNIVHEKTGVYYVEVDLDTSVLEKPYYFIDKWSGIKIDGQSFNPIEMGFEVKINNTFYDIGVGVERPKDYKLVISGIRNNEVIQIGDIRKIKTNAIIPYSVDQKVLIDGIQYRIYVKEGNKEYTVFDFEDVERSYKDNYFLLDTNSLLPNVYYIDVRIMHNQEIKRTNNVVSFRISD